MIGISGLYFTWAALHHAETLAPVTPPDASNVSGPQTATLSGAGVATNNAANGQGNASGGSRVGTSDTPVSPNSSAVGANSPGSQPITINAAPGSKVTLNISSPIPVSIFVRPQQREAAKKYNDGTIELSGKRYETAGIDLRFAVDNLPDFAQAHNNYGLVLFHQKQYDYALSEIKQAIRLSPDNKMYYFNYTNIFIQGQVAVVALNLDPLNFNDFGFFAVINQSNYTLYNLTAKNELVEGDMPFGYTSDQLTVPANFVKPGDITIYSSLLAQVLAKHPEKIRQFKSVITYRLFSFSPPQSQTFYFVAKQDNAGRWDWYPKL